MVVDDLDVMRVTADPAEANPPLVVYPDAVLTKPISGQLLQTVRGWNSEIDEAGSGVQHQQFSKSDPVKIRWQPLDSFPSEKSFGIRVTKAPDHEA